MLALSFILPWFPAITIYWNLAIGIWQLEQGGPGTGFAQGYFLALGLVLNFQ